MKGTVRSKDGGFAQLLRSHKAMALIIFTIVCIALYLVKSSMGPLLHPGLPPPQGEMVVANEHLLEYFKTDGDASKITWAHAVNSNKDLQDALKSDIMMLEADVQVDGSGTAIMAHPPALTSDLTLQTFLDQAKITTKGIKLDFKTTEAAELALKTVSVMMHKMKGRIWLNADIVTGTNGPKATVDTDRFLQMAAGLCPDCLLSLGWSLGKPSGDYKGGYDRTMVEAMREVLEQNKVYKPVTFAVEATYAVLSTHELEWLLTKTQRSSLTLWFHASSQATAHDLVCLRERFGRGVVYMDMSSTMRKEYDGIRVCKAV